MGGEISIVHATQQHAEALCPVLREEDVAEGLALGLEPQAGLLSCLAASSVSYAAYFGGELCVLFGVAPLPAKTVLGADDSLGWVWMLTAQAVRRHKREFLKASRAIVPVLAERYAVLTNVIDARYRGALRWAEAMKFDVRPAVPLGPYGMPFHPFYIRRQAWVG